jgi:hypothetical protein
MIAPHFATKALKMKKADRADFVATLLLCAGRQEAGVSTSLHECADAGSFRYKSGSDCLQSSSSLLS